MAIDDPLLRRVIDPAVREPARRPPRVVALRSAGAAGMGSLLALTAYMTVGGHGHGSIALAGDDTVAPTEAPVTAAAAAATASTTTTLPCANHYTVVSGDYWLRIARRAGIGANVLYALNGASPETPLVSGQSICLPDGVVVAVPTTTPATASAAPPPVAVTTARPAPKTTAKPVVVVTTAAPPTTAKPAAPRKKAASSSKSS